MRKLIVSLALVSTLLLAGCTVNLNLSDGSSVRGSGMMASRDYAETGFSALDVNSAFNVTVKQGDTFKVTVTTDDNLLDYVSVTQSAGTLRIALDTGNVHSFSSTRQEATITMPSLKSVRLNGASRMTMAGFEPGAAFTANLDGSSRLGGGVQATEIRIKSNGASRIDLTGSGTTLTVTADGASSIDLGRLAVEQAGVTLNGASRATVAAGASLDYDLNGASQLTYSGSPIVGMSRVEGSSKVTRQ